MDVENALAGALAAVEHEAVAVGDGYVGCDRAGGGEYRAQVVVMQRAEVVGGRDVILGDDQHVMRRLRIDIPESEDQVILEDDIGRDLAPDYLAKKAIVVERHLFPLFVLTLNRP